MTVARGRLRTRTRLTLWYVLLLSGSLITLGGLGLWAVERTLYANADQLLVSKAGAVKTEIDFERNRLVVELATAAGSEIASVTAGLDLVRVWDANRQLVYTQDAAPEPPTAVPATVEAVLASQRPDDARSATGPHGDRLRLYTAPIRYRERIVGAIEVGRSEAELQAVLGQLRLLGAGGSLVALVWAWCGGYLLAGRALAPVDRITRAARRIGAEDLSQRLNLPLPDDELGCLAAAFDDMIERLDRAFQQQRRFTADASHELRTPLAVIRSQVEIALGRPRDRAYYTKVLASIGEESERLARLTESLLTLARDDAGQPLALAPLDLEELVAEVGADFAARARERQIALGVTLEPIGAVGGDPTWLTQLLVNLLDNALRHTPPGGRIQLALRSGADCAQIEVSDTGEGIPPEHLPHVFERFYRADRARSRAAGGAGLGLAICDRVARAHHGRLTVASVVGQGTTVSLWLPADGRPADESGTEAEPVAQPAV